MGKYGVRLSSVNKSRPSTRSSKQNTHDLASSTNLGKDSKGNGTSKTVTRTLSVSPKKLARQASSSPDPLLLTDESNSNETDPEPLAHAPSASPEKDSLPPQSASSPHLPATGSEAKKQYGKRRTIHLSEPKFSDCPSRQSGRIKKPPDRYLPLQVSGTTSRVRIDSSSNLPPGSPPSSQLEPSQQSSVLSPPPSPRSEVQVTSQPDLDQLPTLLLQPIQRAYTLSPDPEPAKTDSPPRTPPVASRSTTSPVLEDLAASQDLPPSSRNTTSSLSSPPDLERDSNENPATLQTHPTGPEQVETTDTGDHNDTPSQTALLAPLEATLVRPLPVLRPLGRIDTIASPEVVQHPISDDSRGSTSSCELSNEPIVSPRPSLLSSRAQFPEPSDYLSQSDPLPPTPPPTAPLTSLPLITQSPVPPNLNTPSFEEPPFQSISDDIYNYRRISERKAVPVKRYTDDQTSRSSKSCSKSPVKKEEVLASEPVIKRKARRLRRAPRYVESGVETVAGLAGVKEAARQIVATVVKPLHPLYSEHGKESDRAEVALQGVRHSSSEVQVESTKEEEHCFVAKTDTSGRSIAGAVATIEEDQAEVIGTEGEQLNEQDVKAAGHTVEPPTTLQIGETHPTEASGVFTDSEPNKQRTSPHRDITEEAWQGVLDQLGACTGEHNADTGERSEVESVQKKSSVRPDHLCTAETYSFDVESVSDSKIENFESVPDQTSFAEKSRTPATARPATPVPDERQQSAESARSVNEERSLSPLPINRTSPSDQTPGAVDNIDPAYIPDLLEGRFWLTQPIEKSVEDNPIVEHTHVSAGNVNSLAIRHPATLSPSPEEDADISSTPQLLPVVDSTTLDPGSSPTNDIHPSLDPSPIVVEKHSSSPAALPIQRSQTYSPDSPIQHNTPAVEYSTPVTNKHLSRLDSSLLTPLSQATPPTHPTVPHPRPLESPTPKEAQSPSIPPGDHRPPTATTPTPHLWQETSIHTAETKIPPEIIPETHADLPVPVNNTPHTATSPAHSDTDKENITMPASSRKRNRNRITTPSTTSLPSTPTIADAAVVPTELEILVDEAGPVVPMREEGLAESAEVVKVEAVPISNAAAPVQAGVSQVSLESPLTSVVETEIAGSSTTRGKGKGPAKGKGRGKEKTKEMGDIGETALMAGEPSIEASITEDVEMEENITTSPFNASRQETESSAVELGREVAEEMGHAPTPTGQSAPTPPGHSAPTPPGQSVPTPPVQSAPPTGDSTSALPPHLDDRHSSIPLSTTAGTKSAGNAKRKRKPLESQASELPSPAPTTASTSSSGTTKIRLTMGKAGAGESFSQVGKKEAAVGKKGKRKASEDDQVKAGEVEGEAAPPLLPSRHKGGISAKKSKTAESSEPSAKAAIAELAGLDERPGAGVVDTPVIPGKRKHKVAKNRVESGSPTPPLPTVVASVKPVEPQTAADVEDSEPAENDKKVKAATGARAKKPTAKAAAGKKKVEGNAPSAVMPADTGLTVKDKASPSIPPRIKSPSLPSADQSKQIRSIPKIAKTRTENPSTSEAPLRKKPKLSMKGDEGDVKGSEEERKAEIRIKEKSPEKGNNRPDEQRKSEEKTALAPKPKLPVKKAIPATAAPPARAPGLLSSTLAMLSQPAASASLKKPIKGTGKGKGVEDVVPPVVQGSNGMNRPIRPGGWVMSAIQQAEYDSCKDQREAERKAREAWDVKPVNLAPIGDLLREKARRPKPEITSTRGWTSFVGPPEKVGGFWFDPLTMSKPEIKHAAKQD